MDPHLIGETAALCTSVLWTTCSILFASAGRRIGVLSVNTLRLITAMLLLGTVHFILFGTVIPAATTSQWFYLSLSGLIGLVIGDFGYLGALILIGPRKGVLLMSMAPIFSTISAYCILGEVLGAWTLIGITVTLSGVVIVIIEKKGNSKDTVPRKKEILGIFFGLGGSVGQGIGLVISKYGMLTVESTTPLNPLSATLIRIITAAIFVGIVFIIIKRPSKILESYRDRRAVMNTIGGAISGPFLGVWLSMVAVTYTVAGAASTLMSLMPILVIPFMWIIYGEKTNLRGISGAVIAVVGVAFLFIL